MPVAKQDRDATVNNPAPAFSPAFAEAIVPVTPILAEASANHSSTATSFFSEAALANNAVRMFYLDLYFRFINPYYGLIFRSAPTFNEDSLLEIESTDFKLACALRLQLYSAGARSAFAYGNEPLARLCLSEALSNAGRIYDSLGDDDSPFETMDADPDQPNIPLTTVEAARGFVLLSSCFKSVSWKRGLHYLHIATGLLSRRDRAAMVGPRMDVSVSPASSLPRSPMSTFVRAARFVPLSKLTPLQELFEFLDIRYSQTIFGRSLQQQVHAYGKTAEHPAHINGMLAFQTPGDGTPPWETPALFRGIFDHPISVRTGLMMLGWNLISRTFFIRTEPAGWLDGRPMITFVPFLFPDELRPKATEPFDTWQKAAEGAVRMPIGTVDDARAVLAEIVVMRDLLNHGRELRCSPEDTPTEAGRSPEALGGGGGGGDSAVVIPTEPILFENVTWTGPFGYYILCAMLETWTGNPIWALAFGNRAVALLRAQERLHGRASFIYVDAPVFPLVSLGEMFHLLLLSSAHSHRHVPTAVVAPPPTPKLFDQEEFPELLSRPVPLPLPSIALRPGMMPPPSNARSPPSTSTGSPSSATTGSPPSTATGSPSTSTGSPPSATTGSPASASTGSPPSATASPPPPIDGSAPLPRFESCSIPDELREQSFRSYGQLVEILRYYLERGSCFSPTFLHTAIRLYRETGIHLGKFGPAVLIEEEAAATAPALPPPGPSHKRPYDQDRPSPLALFPDANPVLSFYPSKAAPGHAPAHATFAPACGPALAPPAPVSTLVAPLPPPTMTFRLTAGPPPDPHPPIPQPKPPSPPSPAPGSAGPPLTALPNPATVPAYAPSAAPIMCTHPPYPSPPHHPVGTLPPIPAASAPPHHPAVHTGVPFSTGFYATPLDTVPAYPQLSLPSVPLPLSAMTVQPMRGCLQPPVAMPMPIPTTPIRAQPMPSAVQTYHHPVDRPGIIPFFPRVNLFALYPPILYRYGLQTGRG
ncbi:hypothetical protein PAPYR_10099 [Paratrimastix pyriformis]|uniref:Uncharacterized protein n=1 Tax=Paratrimastix pyriformis TaxID=342808 RepID=A0ABQ8UAV6_9EUKA|nr:hypothetical protein PAPYR_10099 [Paratrimastix pyriformis]